MAKMHQKLLITLKNIKIFYHLNFVNKLSNIMILLVVGINLPLEQLMDYLQKQKKKLIWMNNGLQETKRVDYMAIC